MRVPVYDGDSIIIPVTDHKNRKPYRVPVKVIKPVAMLEIKNDGANLHILSRWALLKMLILSFGARTVLR